MVESVKTLILFVHASLLTSKLNSTHLYCSVMLDRYSFTIAEVQTFQVQVVITVCFLNLFSHNGTYTFSQL